MLIDLIRVLEDVQEKPLVRFVHNEWFSTKGGKIYRACPLTQAAMKLGMDIKPDDDYQVVGTLGSDICEFLQTKLSLKNHIVIGIFTAYDNGMSLRQIIKSLKRGDWVNE